MSVLFLPALALAGFGTSFVLSLDPAHGMVPVQLAATPRPPAPTPAPRQLVILQPDDPSTLDPALTTAGPSLNVIANLYETLTAWDDDRVLRPGLATEWEQVDALTWRFRLRPGVRFHDGTPLTAEDVRFSVERVLASGRPAIQAGFETIRSVTALDDQTVQIITAEPDPLLPARLAQPGAEIVSARYVAENGTEMLAVRPMGTGPYRFVAWKPGERLVVEANPDHWAGPPAIKRVVWRPLPDHPTRLAKLEAGDGDVATAIPPGQQPSTTESGARLLGTVDTSAAVLLANTTEGPLADRRVRQALQLAIDVDGLLQSLYAGQGQRLTAALPAGDFGHDPSLPTVPYDPEQARRLLAEAGYGDGFALRLYVGGRVVPAEGKLAEALIRGWSRVGVQGETVSLDLHAYRRLLSERSLPKGGLLLTSMTSSLNDPDGSLWRLLKPTGPGGAYWRGSQPGQAFHDLMVHARRTFDPGQRESSYRAALRILADERPLLELFQPPALYAVGPTVQLTPRSDGRLLVRQITLQ